MELQDTILWRLNRYLQVGEVGVVLHGDVGPRDVLSVARWAQMEGEGAVGETRRHAPNYAAQS